MSPERHWGYVCKHPKRVCWASVQGMAPPPPVADHDRFCQPLVTFRSPGKVSPRSRASDSQGRKDSSDSGLRIQKGTEQSHRCQDTLPVCTPLHSPRILGPHVCVNFVAFAPRANGPELAKERITLTVRVYSVRSPLYL